MKEVHAICKFDNYEGVTDVVAIFESLEIALEFIEICKVYDKTRPNIHELNWSKNIQQWWSNHPAGAGDHGSESYIVKSMPLRNF